MSSSTFSFTYFNCFCFNVIEGFCAKRAYSSFWADCFIFCGIKLIFDRLTCFDKLWFALHFQQMLYAKYSAKLQAASFGDIFVKQNTKETFCFTESARSCQPNMWYTPLVHKIPQLLIERNDYSLSKLTLVCKNTKHEKYWLCFRSAMVPQETNFYFGTSHNIFFKHQ